MAKPTPPPIACEQVHPTLFVRDVRAAAAFYTEKLGFSLGFTWGDPPSMAGVDLDKVSLHLSQGAPHADGCEVYFVVGDVDELHRLHAANGVAVTAPPANKPWGLRQYDLRDLDGNLLVFGQHLPAAEPKLEIERVDVPARLEKRLAAVLKELAEHKGMTLDECLEETLLHTFESFGDGVASPHTKRDLAHIQALKQKHGIDYDTHASYRFIEKK